MFPLFILSAAFLLIYTLLLFSYFIGWNGLENFSPEKSEANIFVSVVVAFRNEEKSIGNLLRDLTSQNYPHTQFEIIAVNDHSDDQSSEIVETYSLNSNVKITLLNLPDKLFGKKNAINLGIELSKGRLILTTDADCRINKNWIFTFVKFYQHKEKPKLIIGLVDLKNTTGFLQGLQNLEFLSLIASGAGAAGIRKPIYCNGANLMFDKSTYMQMKDPLLNKAISGDDTFLLHEVKKIHPNEIFVLKCDDAVVITEPATSLKDFIRQRIRWISKGRYYSDLHIILTSAIVVVSNLTILAWIVSALIHANALLLLPLFYKMIIDWIFIIPVLSYFNKKKLHYLIPVFSIIYPFYVPVVSIKGLWGKFSWKKRNY
jgi:cellulose synthase/poly-beta-1,6-N-acetylglucosamine synthase-like glycosyltransferase